jgi:hypothetical protein
MNSTKVLGVTRSIPMLRKFVCATFALLVCFGILLAEEITAKIVKVDAAKGVVTLKGEKKDKNFKASADTKIVGGDGKELKDGLKNAAFKEGADCTVTYEGKGKDMKVSKIQVK